MVKFLIKRPIATISVLVVAIALGILSSLSMPISLLPDIEIPEVSVHISYDDADAAHLEKCVVAPLRNNLLLLDNTKNITSRTSNGNSVINITFDYGTNIRYSVIEINEKIDAITSSFPDNMTRPTVVKKSVSDIPSFYLNISNNTNSTEKSVNMYELSLLVENVVKRRIEQLSEVSIVDVNGIVENQIQIIPDNPKMASLGLTIDDISNILEENNINNGSLLFSDGYYRYNVQFNSQLKSIKEIRNILLKKHGRILKLSDIAEIHFTTAEKNGANLTNGNEGITLKIFKQPEARVENLKENVKILLKNLKQKYPNVSFVINRDQTKLLSYSITNLQQTLILGIVIAVVVMFLLMKNKRLPFIIAFSIPVSLVISMFFLNLFNVSINIISLSGLILGVGMMIDNSIIVIDNIQQHIQKGMSVDEACVIGTNEVISPLISSVLTTCSVFAPLVFLSGIAGALFFDQAVAVAICLIISLLISIMALPVFFKMVYKSGKSNENYLKIESIHKNILVKILKNKKITVVLFFLLIPIGLILFYIINKQVFPNFENTDTIVNIDWNESITASESEIRMNKICTLLNKYHNENNIIVGKSQYLMANTSGQTESNILAYFNCDNNNQLNIFKAQLSKVISQYFPDSQVHFSSGENIFNQVFNDNQDALEARIRINKNIDNNELYFSEITDSITEILGSLNIEKPEITQKYILSVNYRKLLLYNVNYPSLISTLKNMFGNNKIGSIAINGEFFDIVVKSKKEAISKLINEQNILNTKGKRIPVRNIVSIKKQQALKTIYADNTGNYFPVSIETDIWNYEKIINKVTEKTSNSDLFKITWHGSIFHAKEIFSDFLVILLISLFVLYFILSSQFESLVQPVIVLLEIIIDITGALFMLYIFGSSLNIMACIGIVVMSGIVINDSILKIDIINRLHRSGFSAYEAVIEGGKRRFKPIIMTSLTTILALIPLLFMSGIGVELQIPLALTVIGGLTTGTIVSLYFIPVLYLLTYKNSKQNI